MSSVYSQMSYYPAGFAGGVAIRGVPVVQTQSGKVFWVDNSAIGANDNFYTGANSGAGTYNSPYSTIAYAVTQCRADKGDIIFVKSGHTESVANGTAMTWGTAGVSIIGLGIGSDRPTITFTTATTATINVTANNISVQNMIFVANFAAIVTAFTLTTAADFQIAQCLFKDTSNIKNFLQYVTVDSTANHADGLSIVNNYFSNLTSSAAVSLVAPLAAEDRWTIANNVYMAATTSAVAIIPMSTNALTNFQLTGNVFNVTNATGTATGYITTGQGGGAATGVVANNMSHSLATTPLLFTTGTGLVFFNNLHADAADASGYLLPAVDI